MFEITNCRVTVVRAIQQLDVVWISDLQLKNFRRATSTKAVMDA